MSDCAPARLLPVEEAYELWAPKYDAAPSPLFCLEQRHLVHLLLPTSQCDVVDLGCGTGRWLTWIAALRPRSLIGVDISVAMLERAARALGLNARLVQTDCLSTPLATASADWILASFLLSYVENLKQLAQETARIARPGARVLFSDVHPATREYGWKRTFRCMQQVIEIQTYAYQINDLHGAMEEAGLELEFFSEYCFEDEEKAIFFQAGRPDLYKTVKDLPVLFLASYRRRFR
jgi:malonyl-CoA O-methyltransferase